MAIQVEFFGIPRARMGTSQTRVCEGCRAATLRQVIAELAERFPEFAASCTIHGEQLRPGFVVNLNGQRFLDTDHNELISSGQSILILSADAGG